MRPRDGEGFQEATFAHQRLSHGTSCQLAAPVATTRPGMLPAAGGHGRSCGPGCAARVASALAARRCTPSMTSSANWGCPWMFFLYRPFSSHSSRRGVAGWQAALSAVAAGLPARLEQSASLENRALSLGRDFIREVVTQSPRCVGAFQVMTPVIACGSKGHVQEIDCTASCRSGSFQSWDGRKSAPTGRNHRTLSYKGWLRQNASCSEWHGGRGRGNRWMRLGRTLALGLNYHTLVLQRRITRADPDFGLDERERRSHQDGFASLPCEAASVVG